MTENKFQLNLLRAISPLHVGSGSEIGVVDLPIQREGHTQFPKIDSSSLKGAIRQASYNQEDEATWIKVFGSVPDDKILTNKKLADKQLAAHTGALSITDGRILFFPVQSLAGVFAYVTCPMVLNRFAQDIHSYQCRDAIRLAEVAEIAAKQGSVTTSSTQVLIDNKTLILKEFVYEASHSEEVSAFAEQIGQLSRLGSYFSDRLVIVSDEDFSQFVQYATDVSTRIRIDPETGTVSQSALFNEENLPAESILYTIFYYQNSKQPNYTNEHFKVKDLEFGLSYQDISHYIENNLPKVFQVGGNQTIGRGFIERHTIDEVNKYDGN